VAEEGLGDRFAQDAGRYTFGAEGVAPLHRLSPRRGLRTSDAGTLVREDEDCMTMLRLFFADHATCINCGDVVPSMFERSFRGSCRRSKLGCSEHASQLRHGRCPSDSYKNTQRELLKRRAFC